MGATAKIYEHGWIIDEETFDDEEDGEWILHEENEIGDIEFSYVEDDYYGYAWVVDDETTDKEIEFLKGELSHWWGNPVWNY